MAKKSYEIDMCNGPLLGKILRFAVPLMLSGILQLLFNAADIIVVGQFTGKEALAAVGSTGALINLLVNVFVGLSIGTNVLVAQYIGAQDVKNVSDTVHTSILVSLIAGTVLIFIGIFLAEPMLTLMGTPEDVLDQATLYMRIYFIGMPANMLYNFGAAILRAFGDTQRPLFFLFIAGIVNVVFNLIFVIVFHMGVAGVAIATVMSQTISAVLVLLCLLRADGMYKVYWKQLKIHKDKLLGMARIGLPAGLQGAIFSISNVLIQSSINSFGSVVMAGSTASSNIEGFVYTSMNAIYQANLSFTSQNVGARKYSRINRITLLCVGTVTVVGLVMGVGATLLGTPLLRIYNSDPQVIAYGLERMRIACMPYFLCGVMDVMVGSMRGLGYSILPMVVSLAGACGIRILWIFTVFAADRTIDVLFLSYPVSWGITAIVHMICFLFARRKFPKTDDAPAPVPSAAQGGA
ncbi:MAG TPA: MATE family efflux transporter [Candidatus Merdivicinus faecavium]|nr:MATE family efflux transporter [Candidatus Merdivicinus faecavium]